MLERRYANKEAAGSASAIGEISRKDVGTRRIFSLYVHEKCFISQLLITAVVLHCFTAAVLQLLYCSVLIATNSVA